MRAVVRRVAVDRLGGAAAVLMGLWLRWSGKRAGLAIAYHRVGDPQGDPARELVPKLGGTSFESQLSHLRRHFRAVPAAELREAVRARRRGQRFPVAITFDDDLNSHARVAAPMLRDAGLPATFFLCGASLHSPFSFWWERLQRAEDAGLLTPAEREQLAPGADSSSIHAVAAVIQRSSPETRERVATRLAELTGEDPADAGIRADDVRRVVDAGFEIGFHTHRHHDLALLDDERLATALREGRSALERISGKTIVLIAYPHGSADARVAAAARAEGYETGFTMSPQAVTPETDPLLVGRVEPRYRSTARFALDLVRALRRQSA